MLQNLVTRMTRFECRLFLAAWRSPACLYSKCAFLLGFAWWIVPFDLIPDSVPVIGYSDELAFVVAGLVFSRILVPSWLKHELASQLDVLDHVSDRPPGHVLSHPTSHLPSLAGLPIFVINLERDTDRRRHMVALLESLGLTAEFVTAVDGRTLLPSHRAEYGRSRSLRVYGVEMLDTEIACYLSHRRLYERMVAEGIEAALILEDDVDLHPSFVTVVADLLRCSFTDWLVVRFDCKRPQVRHPPTTKLRGIEVAKLSNGAGLFRLGVHPLGLAAYLIRREGAIRMLEYGRPIFMPIGMTMDRFWENGIVPYIVRPIPVRQLEEIFPASTGSRPSDRHRSQPFPILLRRRIQRFGDGIAKRFFNLVS